MVLPFHYKRSHRQFQTNKERLFVRGTAEGSINHYAQRLRHALGLLHVALMESGVSLVALLHFRYPGAPMTPITTGQEHGARGTSIKTTFNVVLRLDERALYQIFASTPEGFAPSAGSGDLLCKEAESC